MRRPAPEAISLPTLGWRAESIRWLLRTSAWSDAVEGAVVTRLLERLVEGRFDPAQGYARPPGVEPAATFWLVDQAALLAAFVEAHRVTGEGVWLDRVRELADILIARWWGDGGWQDRPGAEWPSRDAIDNVLPSPLGTLAAALQEMGERVDDGRYADRGRETSAMRRSLASASDHWSALVPN